MPANAAPPLILGYPTSAFRVHNSIAMLRLIAFILCTTLALDAEPPRPPDPLYEKREIHDRNGIGKFFLGREIAHVMGHQAAGWLERPEREQEERTDLLLEAIDLKPGENVADIGCGTGYFAERMARKITPGGVVFGVDIQQEMLDLMVRKMRLKQIKNVTPVLGAEADPKLAPESCDLMIMMDVYHEFEFPYEMTRKMIAGLKKGGRLVFVEYRAEDPNVPIKEVHKMSEAQIKKEMAIHPELVFSETKKVLPQQHIVIFRKQ
jgi:SAM-dependent methyltransferase